MAEQLEVEALEYSDDLKTAVVLCPECGTKNEINARDWVVNTNNVFDKDIWYGLVCQCNSEITFALSAVEAKKTYNEQLQMVQQMEWEGL